MAIKYAITAGGNWDDNTTWSTTSGGPNDTTKPTAADDVKLDSNSGNVVLNATAVCRSLDCTGYVGTLSGSATLSIGDATAGDSNIALLFSSGMTQSATSTISLISTSATQQTVTTNGKLVRGTFTVNGAGSSYIQQDAFTTASLIRFTLTAGTWNMSSFSLTCDNMVISGATTRSLVMGTGTITLTGSATLWNATTTTNLTFSGASGTIVQTGAGATHVFIGGGLTYGTLTYMVGGSTGMDVTGSSTFGTLNFSPDTANKALRFTAGTTNTFGTFNVAGTSSYTVTLSSITAATHTLSKASGTVSSDYLSLTNSIAQGGAAWYAGANSIDNGGNTGWIFTAPPSPSASRGSDKGQSVANLLNLQRI